MVESANIPSGPVPHRARMLSMFPDDIHSHHPLPSYLRICPGSPAIHASSAPLIHTAYMVRAFWWAQRSLMYDPWKLAGNPRVGMPEAWTMQVRASTSGTLFVAVLAVAACARQGDGDHKATTEFGVEGRAAADASSASEDSPADPGAAADVEEKPATAEAQDGYQTGIIHIFAVTVREKPSIKSARIGYMRKGTVVRVDGPHEGPGCAAGWYALVDTRGFVCSTDGLRLEGWEEYRDASAPHLPWFDSILPYDYAHVKSNDLPGYNRFPTDDEQKQVAKWLAERRAILEAQIAAIEKALAEGTVIPDPYDIKAEVENPDGTVETVKVDDAYTQDVEEGPVPTEIPFTFVEKIFLRGFYVSVEGKAFGGGSAYWKTLRGLYIKSGALQIVEPPTSHGAVLGGDLALPVGIVIRKEVAVWGSEDGGATLKPMKPLTWKRFDVLPIVESLTAKNGAFYDVGGGRYVRQGDVRRVDEATPPPMVKEPWQRWIDVDVGRQVLLAYEGSTPVYVALVSTGREKQNIEFQTPRGIHTVLSKHVTSTMDNLYATDGPYAIEDVPWTMYFFSSYAIHGAFWHNGFGQVRSHGCINLSPWDARWIFMWADPQLPAGWHSVYSTDGAPGSLVKVHD